MKFSIERAHLLPILTRVNGTIEARQTIPILSNYMLDAQGDRLIVVGTDLDIEIRDAAPANIIVPGTVTCPARELLDAVKRTPDGADIEFEYKAEGDHRLKVRSARLNFRLPTLPSCDFPITEKVKDGMAYQVLPSVLTRLIERVGPAMSSEETRYYLNGAYLHTVTEEGVVYLRMVGTDGHRLHLSDTPAPEGAEKAPGVIVPRKTVNLIESLIKGVAGNAIVTVSNSKISVSLGKMVLTSKVIDGNFPDYARIVPTGNGSRIVTLKASELSKGIDAVGIVSTDKEARSTRFTFKQEGVSLSVTSTEKGTAQAELEAKTEGEPLEVGFNARYVNDICRLLGTGEIVWHLNDAASPSRVTEAGDPYSTFVLMPLRV